MIIESTSWCLNLNINNNIDMRVKKLKSPKILENDIRHMGIPSKHGHLLFLHTLYHFVQIQLMFAQAVSGP